MIIADGILSFFSSLSSPPRGGKSSSSSLSISPFCTRPLTDLVSGSCFTIMPEAIAHSWALSSGAVAVELVVWMFPAAEPRRRCSRSPHTRRGMIPKLCCSFVIKLKRKDTKLLKSTLSRTWSKEEAESPRENTALQTFEVYQSLPV